MRHEGNHHSQGLCAPETSGVSSGRDSPHSQGLARALAQAPASEIPTSHLDRHASHVVQHNISPLPLMYEVDLEGMLGVRVRLTTRRRGQTYIHSV